MNKKIFDDFYNVFNIGETITTRELNTFLSNYFDNLKETTLKWRIYDLRNSGYIRRINSDNYEVIDNSSYSKLIHSVDDRFINVLREYNRKIIDTKRRFPEEINASISVWNTKILNEYTTHQVYMNVNIVEIDKMRLDDLFFYLKNNSNKTIIRKTNSYIEYLLENDCVYVSGLPMRSPIQNKKSINMSYVGYPKIEKVLVDVIVYNKSILPYDLSEIENIYRNIYKRHLVKTKSVLNYARVRGLKVKEVVEDMLRRIGELEDDKR